MLSTKTRRYLCLSPTLVRSTQEILKKEGRAAAGAAWRAFQKTPFCGEGQWAGTGNQSAGTLPCEHMLSLCSWPLLLAGSWCVGRWLGPWGLSPGNKHPQCHSQARQDALRTCRSVLERKSCSCVSHHSCGSSQAPDPWIFVLRPVVRAAGQPSAAVQKWQDESMAYPADSILPFPGDGCFLVCSDTSPWKALVPKSTHTAQKRASSWNTAF